MKRVYGALIGAGLGLALSALIGGWAWVMGQIGSAYGPGGVLVAMVTTFAVVGGAILGSEG